MIKDTVPSTKKATVTRSWTATWTVFIEAYLAQSGEE